MASTWGDAVCTGAGPTGWRAGAATVERARRHSAFAGSPSFSSACGAGYSYGAAGGCGVGGAAEFAGDAVGSGASARGSHRGGSPSPPPLRHAWRLNSPGIGSGSGAVDSGPREACGEGGASPTATNAGSAAGAETLVVRRPSCRTAPTTAAASPPPRAQSVARCRSRHEPQRARSADTRRRSPSFAVAAGGGAGVDAEPPARRLREDSAEPPRSRLTAAALAAPAAVPFAAAPGSPPGAVLAAAAGRATVPSGQRDPRDRDRDAAVGVSPPGMMSPSSRSASSALSKRQSPFKALSSALRGGTYSVGRYLGRGASASVWEAFHSESKERVAVKVFDQGARDRRQAAREMKVLSRIIHPRVLQVHEVVECPLFSHLICELVDGESLRAFVQKQPGNRLQENGARHFYQQVVDGVNHLHERLVVHRDLKLENLLLDRSQTNVKIIDFGFAAQVASKDARLRAFCGTPSYMAPEIIRGEGYSGFAADVWALGVVVFSLLTGALPFAGRTELQLYAKIRRGTYVCPDSLGDLPRRLVRSCLKMEPCSRPSVAAVLRNAWVVGSSGSSGIGASSASAAQPSQAATAGAGALCANASNPGRDGGGGADVLGGGCGATRPNVYSSPPSVPPPAASSSRALQPQHNPHPQQQHPQQQHPQQHPQHPQHSPQQQQQQLHQAQPQGASRNAGTVAPASSAPSPPPRRSYSEKVSLARQPPVRGSALGSTVLGGS
eukprot:TRINITY_DN6558_c0_g1_i2.p1 TRINITY_DN6558_c0_g1~~TRINITY_DN6558_c0_g1_i2.p1  ORF type:complete len:725 (+),score=128.54 TRINITY_DN6558_c0_g1_i2:437-2611(+)